jgi:hypothetical protein
MRRNYLHRSWNTFELQDVVRLQALWCMRGNCPDRDSAYGKIKRSKTKGMLNASVKLRTVQQDQITKSSNIKCDRKEKNGRSLDRREGEALSAQISFGG